MTIDGKQLHRTEESIDLLFMRFAASYGFLWQNIFHSQEQLEFVKSEWADALTKYSVEVIEKAYLYCRANHKNPPTLPQFTEICRTYHSATITSYQAIEQHDTQPEVVTAHLSKMRAILSGAKK